MSCFLIIGTIFIVRMINILRCVWMRSLKLPSLDLIFSCSGLIGLDMSGQSFTLLESINFYIGFKMVIEELEGSEMR